MAASHAYWLFPARTASLASAEIPICPDTETIFREAGEKDREREKIETVFGVSRPFLSRYFVIWGYPDPLSLSLSSFLPRIFISAKRSMGVSRPLLISLLFREF